MSIHHIKPDVLNRPSIRVRARAQVGFGDRRTTTMNERKSEQKNVIINVYGEKTKINTHKRLQLYFITVSICIRVRVYNDARIYHSVDKSILPKQT